MTNQVLIVAANTLNIKEQKPDKGSGETCGTCFEEILRSEGREEEKESKNTDISCFLNLISCINAAAAESSAYEADINNYSDMDLLSPKVFCNTATAQLEDAGIVRQADKTDKFDSNSASGKTEIPDKIEDSTNDVLFQLSKYKETAAIQEQNTDKSVKVKNKAERDYKNENISPAHVRKQNGNEGVKTEGRIMQNNTSSVLGLKTNNKNIKIGSRATPENESSPSGAKAENDSPQEGIRVLGKPGGSDQDSLKVQKKEYYNNSEDKQETSDDTALNEVTTLKKNPAAEVLELKVDLQNKINAFENVTHLIEKVESKIAKNAAAPESDGFQEFDIHIKPEFLGKLEIRLIKNQGGMNVKIITSNQEVRQMLAAHAELMQNQLNDKGIELHNVEIIYNIPLGDGNMQGEESYQQQGRRKASKFRGVYGSTDRGNANGNSIQPDININGTVSYLV